MPYLVLILQVLRFAQDLGIDDLKVESTGCLGKVTCTFVTFLAPALPAGHIIHNIFKGDSNNVKDRYIMEFL